jgi:hypothetical protein
VRRTHGTFVYGCIGTAPGQSAPMAGGHHHFDYYRNVSRLEATDMRMIRWMCGVSLRDRVHSEDLRDGKGESGRTGGPEC